MGFSTDAIHYAQEPNEFTSDIIAPIHMTTTYKQDDIGIHKGYTYSRTDNPTRRMYEQVLAKLEKGDYCLAFSSGVAAIHAIISLLKPEDELLACRDIYGGASRIFDKIFSEYKINVKYFDIEEIDILENKISSNTKLIFVETPTNPLLKILSLRKLSEFAKKNNILSVVDNTFMSPYLQNPLEYGIDIVVHSSTKYIGGHSDVIGGAIITKEKYLYEKFKFYRNATGAIPSPFDCWLLLRSLKTLSIRMKAHCENAEKFYYYMKDELGLKKIYYPLNFKDNKKYREAFIQMKAYGGIVSVDFEDENLARKILRNLKIFTLAESLGGVESLVCFPFKMTHGSVSEEIKLKIGITKSLVRFSLGIEDIEDLIEDLNNAMK